MVAERAGYCCEYCRLPEPFAHYRFHIEHIIPIQHGGETDLDNLAYSCSFCNWKKGPNLGTLLSSESPIIRLFHPRLDVWTDHFSMEDGVIFGKTEIGEATVRLLEYNHPDNIIERRLLIELGRYPL
ncbi:MAG TPA: HNH endonuclease signature motif containing protein [Saprospiraceae bacterium]|nr:HNH endonuclease signature motif containing protein [Saprospiraceae bacterium]